MSNLVRSLRVLEAVDKLADPDAQSLAKEAADRIQALEAALRQARAALVYHTEQTRPIGVTGVALDAINDLLKD